MKIFKVFLVDSLDRSPYCLSLSTDWGSFSLVCQTLQNIKTTPTTNPRSSTEILLSAFSQIFFVTLYKRGDPKILSSRCTIELYT